MAVPPASAPKTGAKRWWLLIDPATEPKDLGRPGHIFRWKRWTVVCWEGQAIRKQPSILPGSRVLNRLEFWWRSMNEDGSMARVPELMQIAKKFNLKIVSIKDLIEYRLKADSLIEEQVRVEMPTKYGHFKLIAFKEKTTGAEHLALIKGTWQKDEPCLPVCTAVVLRATSLAVSVAIAATSCTKPMQMVEEEGKGVILYMNQEGRGHRVIK